MRNRTRSRWHLGCLRALSLSWFCSWPTSTTSPPLRHRLTGVSLHDDTAIYVTVESKTDSDCIQRDLDRLQAWEFKWDMEFNPSKCQVIHVTASRAPLKSEYILHSQVLESVTSARYLGVDISNNVSWNMHVTRAAANGNRSLGFIRRNVKTKSQKVWEMAYQTLVRPQLEYASAIWSLHTITNAQKVEMVQRRAAWWTTNYYARTTGVTSLLHQLKRDDQCPVSVSI